MRAALLLALCYAHFTLTEARHAARLSTLSVPGRQAARGLAETPLGLRGAGRKAKGAKGGHSDMSAPVLVLNLMADLCPHGMLMLAFGMAAHGGTGAVPSVVLLLAFAGVAAYTMWSLGRVASETGESSMLGVWEKLVSRRTAPAAEAVVTSLCFGCCIFYAAFIGDLFFSLSKRTNLGFDRSQVLSFLMIMPLLPLCLLRNLSVLGYSSVVGLGGILYTAGVVAKRSFDGSYLEGAPLWEALDPKYRPTFSSFATREKDGFINMWRIGPGTITLMNMFCVAFMAHYNGIKYYKELKDRSPKRFAYTMGTGLALVGAVFLAFMMLGHRTFGASAKTLLLNNYATTDSLATAARLATGFAILSGFPLMFYALKMSLRSFINRFSRDELSNRKMDMLSVAVLAVIGAIATQTTEENLAVVIGLIGAILGSALGYIMPALLNIGLSKKRDNIGAASMRKSEIVFNYLVVVVGVIFAGLGTYVTIYDARVHH